MASEILIRQAEKMYESELDTTDYANLLTAPAVKAMGDMLKVQRVKTEALIATMPAGVNISKVPEELRPQVTKYLTDNKTAYVEAAKVVASGIKPDDPKYLEAMETMNRIRGGFEALDVSLVKLAENRKLSLDNLDNISPGASDSSSILHNKFANGGIYNDLTLEDGNFYYTDSKGNKINANDYQMSIQQSTGITDSLDSLHNAAIGDKRNNEEFKEVWYRGKIRTNLKKAGKHGRVDFAYSGMAGDDSGQTEFIDKYITETHNGITRESDPKEFERLYQSYKEADFGAGTELGKRLEDYLVNTLKASYDGAKVTGSGKVGNYIINKQQITAETFNRSYKSHVDALNNDVETNGWRTAPNGTRYKKDADGWHIINASGKPESSDRGNIAINIGFDQSHGIDFEVVGTTGGATVEELKPEVFPKFGWGDDAIQTTEKIVIRKQGKLWPQGTIGGISIEELFSGRYDDGAVAKLLQKAFPSLNIYRNKLDVTEKITVGAIEVEVDNIDDMHRFINYINQENLQKTLPAKK